MDTGKTRVSKKFPNSPIMSYLQSLPDDLPAEELIGATAILLGILDATHNNLNSEYIKEVRK